MSIFSRAIVPALMAAVYLATPVVARAQAAGAGQDQPSEETWNSIKGDIFKDRAILDGSGLVVLDAPKRAEDSAIVPIGMRVNLAGDDKRTLKSLTLVIDENPAPVAGTFYGRSEFRRDLDFDAGPRQLLLLCTARRRTQRWPALWREGVREGVRRLLGAGGVEQRRDQGDARADEVPHVPDPIRPRKPRSCCATRKTRACRWTS